MKILLFLFIPFLLFAQLVDEGFEGTGLPTDWSALSTSPNWDYTTTVLEGTQSLYLDATSTTTKAKSLPFAEQGELYGFFICQFTINDATSDNTFMYCYDEPATVEAMRLIWYRDGRLRAYCGTASALSSTYFTENTTYYVWWHYVKGSGSNAVVEVYVSTTGTKPGTKTINITTGTRTTNIEAVYFYATQTNATLLLDAVLVSTTDISDYVNAVEKPEGLTPVNSATGQSVSPTLSWTDQENADSFYVKLSASANLSSALVDTHIIANSYSDTLDYSTQYYWAVAAKNVADTIWSDTISFTTKNLSAPSAVYPRNGYQYTDSIPTLDWTTVTEADSYFVILSENSDLSSALLDTHIVATNYAMTDTLTMDSTYYWILASKNELDTTYTDTLSFKVGIAPESTGSSLYKKFTTWMNKYKGF